MLQGFDLCWLLTRCVLTITSQTTKWPFPSATKEAPAKNYCLARLELLDASSIWPLLVVDKECPENFLTGNEVALPFSNQTSSNKELLSCRARAVGSIKDSTFAGCWQGVPWKSLFVAIGLGITRGWFFPNKNIKLLTRSSSPWLSAVTLFQPKQPLPKQNNLLARWSLV